MKICVLLLVIISLSFSKEHVFLVKKYNKEIELEAKIISKIANLSLKERVKIFIPEMSEQEKDIYSNYFDISDDCKSANFVFNKRGLVQPSCEKLDKLFFTNNYRRLIANKKYYGAFFWNKSRPNIVFIEQRLHSHNIDLSRDYQQYIENIDE